MKKKNIKISPSEWQVLRVILKQPRISALEVSSRLAEKRWNIQTVKTLLKRLVDKGALEIEKQGNRYLYSPSRKEEEFVQQESEAFLDRVFGGQPTSMLLHFIRSSELDPDDIEKLKDLLNEKGKSS